MESVVNEIKEVLKTPRNRADMIDLIIEYSGEEFETSQDYIELAKESEGDLEGRLYNIMQYYSEPKIVRRVYGINTDLTEVDYIDCSDEEFIEEAEKHGLVWEDVELFIKQLNKEEISPLIIQFRYINVKIY